MPAVSRTTTDSAPAATTADGMTSSAAASVLAPMRSVDGLHRRERGRHVLGGAQPADHRVHLAVLADDERGALGAAVRDLLAARVLAPGLGGAYLDAERFRDAAVGVGRRREPARAELRIRGELLEPRDAVERYSDDGGAGPGELRAALRERVRLQVAAAGVCR